MLDHLDDLASDFSAIHGIHDMGALPGPVFYALAERLAAYQGVMAARVAAEAEDAPAQPQPAAHPRRPPAGQVTPTAVLKYDSAFAGVFSFSDMKAAPVPS